MEIDSTDRQILSLLREDGRMPFLGVGKKLGLSEGAVRHRVKKMLASGAIVKFGLETNTEFNYRAIICLKLKTSVNANEAIKKLKSLPYEVNHICEVSGEYDIICFGEAQSHEKMNRLIDTIRRIPGVMETKSFIVLGQNLNIKARHAKTSNK